MTSCLERFPNFFCTHSWTPHIFKVNKAQEDLDIDRGNQRIDLTGPGLKEYIITSCYTIDASYKKQEI